MRGPRVQQLKSTRLPFGIEFPEWNLLFLGFAIFLVAIVTYRLPVGTLGMVLGVIGLLLSVAPVRVPAPSLLMAGVWILAAMGIAASLDRDASVAAVIEGGKTWIVALVAYNAIRTARQARFTLLFVLALYALVPARPALLGYFRGIRHAGRAIGPFIYRNSNDLAAITLLAIGVALCVTAIEHRQKVLRLLAAAFAGSLMILILLTQSRGGFLGLLAMMVPLAIASARKGVKTIVLIGFVVVAAMLVVPTSAWTRLGGIKKLTNVETIDEADPEGSAAERLELIKMAARIIADHPVMGIGRDAYARANYNYSVYFGDRRRYRDTHNTYLHLAAECGIPALLLFLVAIGLIFRFVGKARKQLLAVAPDRAAGLAHLRRGLFGFLVAGFFGSYEWLGILHIYLGLIWSIAAVWTLQLQPATAIGRSLPRVRRVLTPSLHSPSGA